ncbi:MAG: hypothetical protein ABSD74_11160 [Rhizomicrobium sp.]|jgi:ElaB/YqjD/DUF883 family membrane-anchored ribosome-binding protein
MSNTDTEMDIQTLSDELKQLRAEFSKIAQLLESAARHAGDEATQVARDASERAWSEVKNRADGLARRIEEKPVSSTAWAFGIGILIGFLCRGRS